MYPIASAPAPPISFFKGICASSDSLPKLTLLLCCCLRLSHSSRPVESRCYPAVSRSSPLVLVLLADKNLVSCSSYHTACLKHKHLYPPALQEVAIMTHHEHGAIWKFCIASFSTALLLRSRWLVGSSSISRLKAKVGAKSSPVGSFPPPPQHCHLFLRLYAAKHKCTQDIIDPHAPPPPLPHPPSQRWSFQDSTSQLGLVQSRKSPPRPSESLRVGYLPHHRTEEGSFVQSHFSPQSLTVALLHRKVHPPKHLIFAIRYTQILHHFVQAPDGRVVGKRKRIALLSSSSTPQCSNCCLIRLCTCTAFVALYRKRQ